VWNVVLEQLEGDWPGKFTWSSGLEEAIADSTSQTDLFEVGQGTERLGIEGLVQNCSVIL